MNHLGLTVFAGKIPGIILDFDKESKEYTIEFLDGRVVTTSVVNWESSIPAEPEVAKYRLANLQNGEALVFGDEGWDVVSSERLSIENRWPHTDRLVAPGYQYSVDMEGGTINLYAPDGHRIGSLTGHTAPALGNEADALWNAAEWLLLAPNSGHGVDENFWDEHGEEHLEWLKENASKMDDILSDFADAAVAQGSVEARSYLGLPPEEEDHGTGDYYIARTAADYWETGAPHEISHGEDADEDHMRSDVGGNSDLRHTEKELYNNTKDEEGNPQQNFPDGEEEVIMPPVPADVERFMERAETAEPDPMKTDREFPSGEYKERSRIPQHSHVREQAAWEDKHYANNPVCEDCGDPLVNGMCYSCCDKKKGISPEEYGKIETDTVIRQANTKVAGPLALLAAPVAEAVGGALGVGAAEAGAGAAAGAAEGGILSNLGSMVGKAYRPLMIGNALNNLTGGGDEGDSQPQQQAEQPEAPTAQYQSIVAATEPDTEIFAYENRGDNSNPDIGGTGGYNETHGDGPEYMKDVNDVGGTIAVIRRFTDMGDMDGAIDHAMSVLAEGIPAVIEFADSEESGKGVKEIDDFDELLEAAFGEDYTKHRDGDKKTSKVAADGMVLCETCGNNVALGATMCSENPPRIDCPAVKMNVKPGVTPSTQQQPPAQQRQIAPVTQAPGGMAYAKGGTLDFPVSPKLTTIVHTLKVAARRPKMCPYHTELVDYSIALSNPSAALSALSQHLYSDHSCKGGWGEAEGTKCRFKPEMVQGEYWEQKEREAEERKQQREQEKALQEQQSMEEVQEVLVAETETEGPIDPEYSVETEEVSMDATNVGDDTPAYNDYIPAENYADYGSAVDSGSYDSASMGEPVMASARDWLMEKTAEEHEDKEDVRVYEYPGEDHYEDGSADGDRIQDTDGNELEQGETYRIGPEGQIPDVVEVVSVDPQYIEVRRIDSTFPENENNRPYRLTLKDIMVQDIQIERTGDQINPAEIGGGEGDALMGTPEANNDAGAGHQDTHGTTDLSTGQYASSYRLAGRDYSSHEQRSFVNENGTARNLDKLDLEGTHYPEEMSDSLDNDYFLWG